MFKKLNNIGDCGIVCDFGDEVNRSINTSVIKLFHHIRREVLNGNLDGILNYTPSYNKLIINFDLRKINSSRIFDFLKSDMTWHKPTQGFSSSDNFFKVLWNNALNDGFDDSKFKNHFESSKKFKFDHNDIKAFGILGITVGLKWDKIQKKFKKLVKKFHPDINAGDKKFEEKLKVITLAYTQLKNTYRKRK